MSRPFNWKVFFSAICRLNAQVYLNIQRRLSSRITCTMVRRSIVSHYCHNPISTYLKTERCKHIWLRSSV